MNFSLTDTQTLLRNSAERFIRDKCASQGSSRGEMGDQSVKSERWKMFAELGWLALPFAEEFGGQEMSPVETMILMQIFGENLVVEPYLASVILAGGILRHAANENQKKTWLPGVIQGQSIGSFAYAERNSGFELACVSTTAEKVGENFVLTGKKVAVISGPKADFLIVSARTSGQQSDREGISLFVVDVHTTGVERVNYRTSDGFGGSEFAFNDVRLSADAVLGSLGEAWPCIENVSFEAIVALCAEALGAMDALNRITLEYTKIRVQFGQPIGKFQVLKHRMVDMLIEFEQCKSLLLATTAMLAVGDPDIRRHIAALKVQVGHAGRFIGQQAIQLHGGIGMTDALNVGHYFKRLIAIDILFGSADFHMNVMVAHRNSSSLRAIQSKSTSKFE